MPSTLLVGEIIHTHDLSSYVYGQPNNVKHQWCGGRAVFSCGGAAPIRQHMQYVNIGVTSNAIDFADVATGQNVAGSVSNGWRGIICGGQSPTADENQDFMQYFTVGILANSVDFNGDLNAGRAYLDGGCSNGARGAVGGGSGPSHPYTDAIDYFGFIVGEDAKDFGNLTEGRLGASGTTDGNGGTWSGGWDPGASDVIDYITIGTPAEAVDIGNLTQARHVGAQASNGSRAVTICGATYDTIDYYVIGHIGNAVDFGEATVASNYLSATSDGERAVRAGGDYPPAGGAQDRIDYFNIGQTSNAIDFGNLDVGRSSLSALSGN
ncbi:MAG: hypothetical protein VX237_08045 [Chloroflexota bacterium]|nr:hypothetical protein [Chloroflexota bacterium]